MCHLGLRRDGLQVPSSFLSSRVLSGSSTWMIFVPGLLSEGGFLPNSGRGAGSVCNFFGLSSCLSHLWLLLSPAGLSETQ